MQKNQLPGGTLDIYHQPCRMAATGKEEDKNMWRVQTLRNLAT
ncbi:MAG: hypothetical protein AB2792_13550 [Candidatus Thiodiazotropha sp.]